MTHDTLRPLPLASCPECQRPIRGPRTVCDCGSYCSPPTLDERRLVKVREARETLHRARRSRRLMDAYLATLDEHAA